MPAVIILLSRMKAEHGATPTHRAHAPANQCRPLSASPRARDGHCSRGPAPWQARSDVWPQPEHLHGPPAEHRIRRAAPADHHPLTSHGACGIPRYLTASSRDYVQAHRSRRRECVMTAEPPHRIGPTARRLRRQGDPTLTGPVGAVDDDILVEWPGSLIERAEGTSRQAASTEVGVIPRGSSALPAAPVHRITPTRVDGTGPPRWRGSGAARYSRRVERRSGSRLINLVLLRPLDRSW